MFNEDLKLDKEYCAAANSASAGKFAMKSMRAGFGEGLLQAGTADKRVVALCADLADSVQMTPFKKKYPERFVEVGVAEQNLVTVASGMAAMGKIPFAASYAVFSPGRNWEQIRTTVCYNNVPVKIIGSHVGVSVGPDGGSHQALEDIALMRVLPRMNVFSPCDANQARKAAMAMARTGSPAYMRLARDPLLVITTDETPFELGKGQLIWEWPAEKNRSLDVAIVVTGSLLHQAILTALKLKKEGKHAAVLNVHTIKPLDEVAIIEIAHRAGALVTVEEHQIAGGLGSAVAECLVRHISVPVEFVGVKDQFGQSGTSEELLDLYGLSEKHIYKAVQKAILRKR